MPACPFCQTEIPDDFGLIECPNCQASLFVDMDGSVEASAPAPRSDGPSLQPEEPDEEFGATFAAQLVDESLGYEEPPEVPLEDQIDHPEEPVADEPVAEEPIAEEPIDFGSQGDELSESEPLEDFSSNEPQNESFESALAGPDQPLEVPAQVQSGDGSMDISNMATAMDQEGVSEGLRYDLEITGIDTADLRREVMESLMDKKLGWNVEDLMARITGGSLTLKGVTAVKAHVVVQRLKTLPLEMRWDQHADS